MAECLLGLDTASPFVTVAVHDGSRVVAEARSERAMRHGEELAPLVEACLREAGVHRRDLTRVAVGSGPGPYTGLRVGLVTARTLGFALGVPVVGVCTLDVVAAEAAVGLAEEFWVATDARRREVYAASYDASGQRLTGPVVGRPAALATDRPVAGQGAELYPEAFPRAVAPALPSAGWLARVVVEGLAPTEPPEPRYLRRPDAATPGPQKPVT